MTLIIFATFPAFVAQPLGETPQPCEVGQTWTDVFEGANYNCMCTKDGQPDCTVTDNLTAPPCTAGQTWKDVFEGAHYNCICMDGKPDCTATDDLAALHPCKAGQTWTDLFEGDSYNCVCTDGQPDCTATVADNTTGAPPPCEGGQKWTDVFEGDHYDCICTDGQPDCTATDNPTNIGMILLFIACAVLLMACILATSIALYCYRTRGKTGNQNSFGEQSVVTETEKRVKHTYRSGRDDPSSPCSVSTKNTSNAASPFFPQGGFTRTNHALFMGKHITGLDSPSRVRALSREQI